MSGDTVRLSVSWTGPTKEAVNAAAAAGGLSISAVSEQLICEALAARTRATIETAASPAITLDVDAMIRTALQHAYEAVEMRMDTMHLEIAATRLLSTATIMYLAGDTAARQAEEACIRRASAAVRKGEMASLPPGICR